MKFSLKNNNNTKCSFIIIIIIIISIETIEKTKNFIKQRKKKFRLYTFTFRKKNLPVQPATYTICR